MQWLAMLFFQIFKRKNLCHLGLSFGFVFMDRNRRQKSAAFSQEKHGVMRMGTAFIER
jgi:hypothetical protein